MGKTPTTTTVEKTWATNGYLTSGSVKDKTKMENSCGWCMGVKEKNMGTSRRGSFWCFSKTEVIYGRGVGTRQGEGES